MDMARLVGRHEGENSASDVSDARGVVIKCYTDVGSISGYGKVSVDARELISIDAQHAVQYVGIEVETGGDYPQTNMTSISYNNIDNLIAIINKLKNIDPKSSKFSQIEASSEVDGLKITVFNTQKTKMMCGISIDSSSIHFDLYRLDEFKRLILQAKSVIDQCRSGG